jgi:ABC-type multidrug transport system ATPase subunit
VSASVIQIDHVSRRFGAVQAVNDITFEVPRGSIFALIGANGAGKTTLFSMIAGYLQPTAGRIIVAGIDVAASGGALRGRFGILPQDAAFSDTLNIKEHLVLFARLGGATVEAARNMADAALAQVGLTEAATRRARQLSHGMHKRLGIAQAFLGEPDVVLLDEPTAGLDPANALQIRKLVQAIAGDRTVVISSHNLAELQDLCDHVAIIDQGRLVTAGPMAAFLGAGSTLRLRLNRAPDEGLLAALRSTVGVRSCEADRDGLQNPADVPEMIVHLDVADQAAADATTAALLRVLLDAGVVPRALSEGARLEARFLELTK